MKPIYYLIVLNLFLIPLSFYFKFRYQPRVLLIPHHNLVQTVRQSVINDVARRRPSTQTVILLSPDHFNPSQFHLTTGNSDWTLANGQIFYDHVVGSKLASLLTLNGSAVKQDHGIYNLLPDIHAAFPQAKIVPILLGQNLKPDHLNPLLNQLNQSCQNDCLLIASVDFSHYLPLHLANVHDAYSLKILSNHQLSQIMSLEVDSPQALYLALSFAQFHQSHRFIFKAHTNSGALTSNFETETTSHLMGWYQKGKPDPINLHTFVYATNLSFTPHQKTVGDRFFYGSDLTQSQLNTPQHLPGLTLIPSATTSLKWQPDHLTIHLGDDFALAGIDQSPERQLFFLPLTGLGNQRFFSRGLTRSIALHNLFYNLPVDPSINPQTGVIFQRL